MSSSSNSEDTLMVNVGQGNTGATPVELRVPCHEDVGFGFRCLREKGHAGYHTWDPERTCGEKPVVGTP